MPPRKGYAVPRMSMFIACVSRGGFQELSDCLHKAFWIEILHAIVGTCRRIVARTFKLRLKYFPEAVQFKLVLVENIIKQNDLLPQSDGNVHCHRDRRNDKIALVDEVDEMIQRIVTVIFCTGGLREFQIFCMFLLLSLIHIS